MAARGAGRRRERHRRATAEARRRERLEEAATDPSIDRTLITWKAARETLDLRGPVAAEPLLRAVLDRAPDHAGARVLLGHHLLNLGNPEGRHLLEQVVGPGRRVVDATGLRHPPGHFRLPASRQLREIRSRLDRHEQEIAAAQRERATVKASDSLLPHELADAEIEPLRRVLAAQPDCGAAWLVPRSSDTSRSGPCSFSAFDASPQSGGSANPIVTASWSVNSQRRSSCPGRCWLWPVMGPSEDWLPGSCHSPEPKSIGGTGSRRRPRSPQPLLDR